MKRIGRVVFALWLAVATLGLQACAPAGLGSASPISRSSYSPSPYSPPQGRLAGVPDPVPRLSAGSLTDAQLGQQMTDYFKAHRLPLVGAQVYTDSRGARQVVLFGLVATSFGKSDATAKATSMVNDPTIAIVNRVKIDPNLMAANGGPEPPAENPGSSGVTGQAPPPSMGGVQDYENQNRGYPGSGGVYSYQQQQQLGYQQQQQEMMMRMLPYMMGGGGVGFGSGGFGTFGGSGMAIPLTSPYGAPPGGYPMPGPYNPFFP